jgi:hypothetical protein
MANVFSVTRKIQSLEEIVDEVPEGTTELQCIHNNCRSLRGIERLPSVTTLSVVNNQISSFDGLVGSQVTTLSIYRNQITSLEGLAYTKVTKLYISHNPCYEQFINEFEGSVQKVKERYEVNEIKDPGCD